MAEIVPIQPVLPAEGPWTEAELNYASDEPPGFFPENQDSNWGIQRRIFSKQQQDLIDQLNTMYAELFLATSSQFLDVWEAQLGLPVNPSGVPLAARRNRALARMKKGAFTDALRASVIEPFLYSTFGDVVKLVPEGIPVTSAGIPLYGEPLPVIGLYRVYDDISGFSYQVWISSSNTPDIPSLQRELQRITPAGITFTIDNTHLNVLDYDLQVLHDGPHLYLKLGANANDSTGIGDLSTAVSGTVTFGAASLPQNTAEGGATFTRTGSGRIQASNFRTPEYAFTWEAWMKPAAFSTDLGILGGNGGPFLNISSDGRLQFILENYLAQSIIVQTAPGRIVANQTYFIRATFDGKTARLYINNVLESSGEIDGPMLQPTTFYIGRTTQTGYFNGVLDEVALYNYAVSQDKPYDHYSVGMNVV